MGGNKPDSKLFIENVLVFWLFSFNFRACCFSVNINISYLILNILSSSWVFCHSPSIVSRSSDYFPTILLVQFLCTVTPNGNQ